MLQLVQPSSKAALSRAHRPSRLKEPTVGPASLGSAGSLALWLLLCLSCPLLSLGQDCFQQPWAPECAAFRVDEAVQADLDMLCKPVTSSGSVNGWPAACTLHVECTEGRGSPEHCSHLALMFTACQEGPQLLFCSKYLSLCGPGSVVEQCLDAAPITSLPPASDLYLDVFYMCEEQPELEECARCTANSGGPGEVSVQAVSISCPDPLGSASRLCLNNTGAAGCDGWAAFCNATAGAFGGICGNGWAGNEEALALAPAPNPAVTELKSAGRTIKEELISGSGSGSSGGRDSSGTDCYTTPQDPSCADFRQDDATSRQQIEQLCKAMPGMVGCTLWHSCTNGSAAGRYCAAFSILGDVCIDMPTMRGCEGFMQLCGPSGSVVRQCREEGPAKHALLSDDATRAVLDMCSTHAMPQCEQCTSRFKCPDPLATLSSMCLDMPGMSECAQFFAFCDEVGDTFKELCGGSRPSGPSGLPPMKMYLHQSVREIILFKSWVPNGNGAYVASLLAVLLSAVGVQALKAWRVKVELQWSHQRLAELHASSASSSSSPHWNGPHHQNGAAAALPHPRRIRTGGKSSFTRSDASGMEVPLLRGRQPMMNKGQVRRNAVRAAFAVVIVFVDYMLMLIVMTFNVGLIVAAVLGFGLGAMLFGHVGEQWGRRGREEAVALLPGVLDGAPDPDPEANHILMEEQHSCCQGH